MAKQIKLRDDARNAVLGGMNVVADLVATPKPTEVPKLADGKERK